jgi:hypothetical protein
MHYSFFWLSSPLFIVLVGCDVANPSVCRGVPCGRVHFCSISNSACKFLRIKRSSLHPSIRLVFFLSPFFSVVLLLSPFFSVVLLIFLPKLFPTVDSLSFALFRLSPCSYSYINLLYCQIIYRFFCSLKPEFWTRLSEDSWLRTDQPARLHTPSPCSLAGRYHSWLTSLSRLYLCLRRPLFLSFSIPPVHCQSQCFIFV